jgi:hypothetical protein
MTVLWGIGWKPKNRGKVLNVGNVFDACEQVVKNLPRASGFLGVRSRRDEGGGTATVPYQTIPGTGDEY